MGAHFDFRPDLNKPTIPISLFDLRGPASIACDALVDTGSDICLFDAVLLEGLGRVLETGVEASFDGLNGQAGAAGYIHPVDFEITTLADWGRFRFEPLFVRGLADAVNVFGILGSSQFLDRFVLKIDVKNRGFDIENG